MNTAERWQAVDALFGAVVELDTAGREAMLAGYEGEAAVRDEVRSLLAALTRGGARLEPSLDASHLTLRGTTAQLSVTLTGRRLGPWSVVREVGRGGMGVVYEAFRADDQYQKRVAVKTLTRGADGEVVARRFQQERQILASLEHPGIATLIDGGVTDDGLPYLVMEYVDGAPIDRYCAAHRLTLRQRLDVFRQVCAAVQYAHRNLVVHRDLKPSNILVTANGDVKLVDFGIAKLMSPERGRDVTLTEAGQRAFTTGYASPEQVRGEAMSTSTDVYSLGATLFHLLTGRLPFELGQVTAVEAVRRISEEAAPAPSRVCTADAAHGMRLPSRAALARELAGEVDDMVIAALRKEPERRYATVAAFSEDIKRFLQGQQVAARPDTWRYRFRSFSRRNPKVALAGSIAVISLATGAYVAGIEAQRAGRARDRARAEAARSARVVGFLEQLLAAPAQGALTDATMRALDDAMIRAQGELADDPLARAAVYRTAAKAYAIHNRNEQAAPLVDSALALDRHYAGARSVEVARDLTVAARVSYNAGLLDSAVAQSREASDLLRVLPSDRPDDLPWALLTYSFALTYSGRPVEGVPVAQEGIALLAHKGPSAMLAFLHMAVGETEAFRGHPDGARTEYLRAAAIYDSLPGAKPVELGVAELGLGRLYIDEGNAPEASRHARRALEILERSWGPDHAYTGRAHSLLARIAVITGDSATATREIAATRAALAHSRLGLVDWATININFASVLYAAGQREEAVTRLRTTLDARRGELVRAPHIMSNGEWTLGLVLVGLHRPAEARIAFDSAFARQRTAYGPRHAITLATARQLVFVAAALGDDATIARFAPMLPSDSVAAITTRGREWGR